ncbi:MAG: zinc-dependent peptidase [Saprospiraceae bacterium]
MLSRILSAPFVIAALGFLYLTWEQDSSWAIYIVPNVVAMAVIFVFSPQIDFWWAKRNTPEMNPQIRMLLTKEHPFYRSLSEKEQKRFRDRVVLYMMANEFMPQKMEEVPPDLQAIVASNIVHLTFGLEDYLLSAFEHVIIYPRPFPSPQYPKNFHTSEIYPGDKVILFAIEQLLPGTINPQERYNIGLHEYIRAYLHIYGTERFSKLEESHWEKLEEISSWGKDHIFKYINRPDVTILPVSICHFFIFGKQFQAILPEEFELYKKIFCFDPTNESNPIVDNHLLATK